jgi:hypothetical protein
LNNVEQADGVYINTTTGTPAKASGSELLRHDTDLSFVTPPAAVGTWNKNDFESLPRSDDEETIKPTTVETQSSSDQGWIQQAYVEIFSIDPSTRLLGTEGDSTLYVSPDSTVRVASDWNDGRPPEDSTEYFGEDEEYRITYEEYETSHRVKIINGPNLYDAPTAYERKMEFEAPTNTQESHTYGVGVEFKLSMYQHHETEVETEFGTEWVTVDEPSKRYTDTLFVKDVREARAYQPNASAIRQPREVGAAYHVTTEKQPVAGISTPAETYRTNWRYFTARDPSWDNITHIYPVTPVDSEVDRYSSNAHPVQTYAYPVPNATPIATGPGSELRNTLVAYRGDNRGNPPKLTTATQPESGPGTYPNWPRTWGIDLNTFTGEYTTINEFIFTLSDQYDEQAINETTPIEITGIVYNQSHSISAADLTTASAPKTELTATTLNQTGSDTTIRLELTTAEGTPINTADTAGHIEIADSTVDTNTSGQAVVTLSQTPNTAQYQPAPFYSTASPKRSSEVYISPSPSIPSVGSALDEIFTVIFLFGLFFMPLFILDRILDADVWPPWEGVWKELF